MNRRLLVPSLAVALGLSLAACGGQSSSATAAAQAPGSADPTAQHLKLVGTDTFMFEPSMLQAKAGHIVIDFHDNGSYPHNVRFPGLHKVSKATTGGITGNDVSLDLGTLKTGSYPFVCDYHLGAGMKGTLVVS